MLFDMLILLLRKEVSISRNSQYDVMTAKLYIKYIKNNNFKTKYLYPNILRTLLQKTIFI